MIVCQPTQEMPAEQFTATLAAVCGHYDVKLAPGQTRLWGGVEQVSLGDWDIALVATDMQSAIKTPALVRKGNCDSVFLILQQFGQSVLQQNDRAVRLLPGDMMLIDSAQPSNFSFFGQRSMQISLHVPRDHLVQRFGQGFTGGLALQSANSTARSIAAILEQVCNAPGAPQKTQLQKETLLGLLGLFVLDGAQADRMRARAGDDVLWSVAQQEIARGFQNPALTGADIARRVGVSLRKLQRSFTFRNTTIRQELMTARLEYARNALGADGPMPTISAIALNAGFSDISYFSRRFREAYGCSPRAYMHAKQPADLRVL